MRRKGSGAEAGYAQHSAGSNSSAGSGNNTTSPKKGGIGTSSSIINSSTSSIINSSTKNRNTQTPQGRVRSYRNGIKSAGGNNDGSASNDGSAGSRKTGPGRRRSRKGSRKKGRGAARHGRAPRSTAIVTSFVRDAGTGRILILRRSSKVRTMQGMWSGVSGVIEGDEKPASRARIEIFEETGITRRMIRLVRQSDSAIRISSPQYRNHEWRIHAFLFEVLETPEITLNWENSDYRWVEIDQIRQYNTVPDLGKVLFRVL